MEKLYYIDLRPFTECGRSLVFSKKRILEKFEVFCFAQSYREAGIPLENRRGGWRKAEYASPEFQRYYGRVLELRKMRAQDLAEEFDKFGMLPTSDGLWWSPYQLGDYESVGYGIIDSELGGGTCCSGSEFYVYDIIMVEIPVFQAGEEIW